MSSSLSRLKGPLRASGRSDDWLARRPTSTYVFFKNTHQSEQLLLKQEVLLGNLLVKAKSLAVSVMSNSSLKKITWAFLRFYLYFLFKINIFKMQLLKNDTANLVAFNIFWSHFISSFRKSCPLWCIILKKINFQKIFGLVGRRGGGWRGPDVFSNYFFGALGKVKAN